MRCVLVVYQDLGPAGQSQNTKGLRLDLDRDIEFLLKCLQSASPPPDHLHSISFLENSGWGML